MDEIVIAPKGEIVIAPKEEQKNKNRIFEILHTALRPGIREDPKIKSIFLDILNHECLSTEYSEQLSFSRPVTIEDREYISTYFHYDPSREPFAWMCIYYSSSNGRLDKLFGAKFSQKGRKTEMFVESVNPPEDLESWISILKQHQN